MKIRKEVLLSVALVVSLACGFALGWTEPRLLSEESVIGSSAAESESIANTEEDPEATETTEAEDTAILIQKKTPWQEPNFKNQNTALGWSPDVFKVPPAMQERVDFWRQIYSRYTTDEGVIHDSEHVGVVYETVDFRPIMSDTKLSDREKSRARRRYVNDRKKAIREALLRVAKASSVDQLSEDDKRIWNLFSKIEEPNKFVASTHRKRLRFQLGQKDRFLQGIYYSGRYLRDMERVFREKGLPIELTRLPFVESSFNVKARSRVGASGIWQFMRYTGRRFLRINGVVDERNDPLRATEAAARLFRINYEMLNLWPLAITGYNHGPAGVQRVVKKFKTDDISELVDERHGRFGFASANFYACFLAALEVEKNARQHFGNELYWDSAPDAREIRVSRSMNRKLLLKWFGNNLEQAQDMNPHIQRVFWNGYSSLGAKEFVRVPTAVYETAMADLKAIPTRDVAEATHSRELETYAIAPGETLSEIASQFGISVQILKDMNGIENPRAIRAGQKLVLPSKAK